MGDDRENRLMTSVDLFALYWFFIKYLLTFAAFIIFLSSIDDLFIDIYFWSLKLWRYFFIYSRHKPFDINDLYKYEEKPLAIMVPAWQEAGVVAEMAALAASTFEYFNYHIFVGTYPNDPDTQAEVDIVVKRYTNVHKVVTLDPGPTSKSDCLNNIAMQIFKFEETNDVKFEAFILHDAEDVIHPLELKIFNYLLRKKKDLIQVPVIPFEREWYMLTSGHYEDEFAEVHGKDMVVREHLLGFVPSAGVGTALSRRAIEYLIEKNKGEVFALGTLTEDYKLGFDLFKAKMNLIFVRLFKEQSTTVKTLWGHEKVKKRKIPIGVREFFPATLQTATRQKSRWIVGIVFQGWKQIGWRQKGIATKYFLFRDRKAIVTNFANLLAYFLVANVILMMLYANFSKTCWWFPELIEEGSMLWYLLIINFFLLLNRIAHRAYFSYQNHGVRGALLAFPRMIWGNIINMIAMWRAVKQVLGVKGNVKKVAWDKTTHDFPTKVTSAKHLGEIIVEKGIVSKETLDRLLKKQRESYKPIGAMLLDEGLIDECGLTRLLSDMYHTEPIKLREEMVDNRLLRKLDKYKMVEYDILPLKSTSDAVEFASGGKPVEVTTKLAKEQLGAKNVKVKIAPQSAIDRLQNKLLFPKLGHQDFLHLKKVLQYKMLPTEMIPTILETTLEQRKAFVDVCRSYGFLPGDQLKRIAA